MCGAGEKEEEILEGTKHAVVKILMSRANLRWNGRWEQRIKVRSESGLSNIL